MKPETTHVNTNPYDAVLIMSFGGPEGPDDVIPFLDNVLRGRSVPEERTREVAHHYDLFGGVSPINAQNRALQVALEKELRDHGLDVPVYLGNRNWHPFVTDTLRAMNEAGVKRFVTFVTSAFSCYSGCRQYREDIERARLTAGPDAPASDKIRVFYNHPAFIEVWRENIQVELRMMPDARVVFTAHSLPTAMADRCDYVAQLKDACTLVSEAAGIGHWNLVFQSRSGSPRQPWLEPDVLVHLREGGKRDVIVAPIGFISDHLEVLYDLDHEAKALCDSIGMRMVRARTPGTHPRFVAMIRELIEERVHPGNPKRALGARGPKEDICPADCCLAG